MLDQGDDFVHSSLMVRPWRDRDEQAAYLLTRIRPPMNGAVRSESKASGVAVKCVSPARYLIYNGCYAGDVLAGVVSI